MSYPTTSRAAVLPDYNQPVEIWDIEIPELEPDAILVKVEASTMCGTDAHMAAGDYAEIGTSRVPLVMGHEIVGRIVALGPKRTVDALNRPLAEGDLIAWAYPWCDSCYWCTIAKQPTLCANARPYGWGPVDQHPYLTGGYAEYCYVVGKCKVVKVPDSIPAPLAASATCAFRTVMHSFEAFGRLQHTDTVVVQGPGAVGLYAIAYAIASGVGRLICIGAPDHRLEVARRWGADDVLSIETTSVEERRAAIHEATDGRGADVVVECSGSAAAFEEGLDLLRRGGRYLIVGQADTRQSVIHATHFNLRQLTVQGTLSADVSHFYRALAFIERHASRFPFEDVLGRTYRLDQVDDALADIRQATSMKPIILPHAA